MSVAISGPTIKLVYLIAVAFGIRIQPIDTAKSVGIVRVYRVSAASAGDFALAAANFDDGRVSSLVHGDAVNAGLEDGERQVGRINLVGLGLVEAPHAQKQSSRAQLNLCDVVAQIQE